MSLHAKLFEEIKRHQPDTYRFELLSNVRHSLLNFGATDNDDDFVQAARDLRVIIQSEIEPSNDESYRYAIDELRVLDEFIPRHLTQDEVGKIVSGIISTGIERCEDVVAMMNASYRGRFDPRMVSSFIQKMS